MKQGSKEAEHVETVPIKVRINRPRSQSVNTDERIPKVILSTFRPISRGGTPTPPWAQVASQGPVSLDSQPISWAGPVARPTPLPKPLFNHVPTSQSLPSSNPLQLPHEPVPLPSENRAPFGHLGPPALALSYYSDSEQVDPKNSRSRVLTSRAVFEGMKRSSAAQSKASSRANTLPRSHYIAPFHIAPQSLTTLTRSASEIISPSPHSALLPAGPEVQCRDPPSSSPDHRPKRFPRTRPRPQSTSFEEGIQRALADEMMAERRRKSSSLPKQGVSSSCWRSSLSLELSPSGGGGEHFSTSMPLAASSAQDLPTTSDSHGYSCLTVTKQGVHW